MKVDNRNYTYNFLNMLSYLEKQFSHLNVHKVAQSSCFQMHGDNAICNFEIVLQFLDMCIVHQIFVSETLQGLHLISFQKSTILLCKINVLRRFSKHDLCLQSWPNHQIGDFCLVNPPCFQVPTNQNAYFLEHLRMFAINCMRREVKVTLSKGIWFIISLQLFEIQLQYISKKNVFLTEWLY